MKKPSAFHEAKPRTPKAEARKREQQASSMQWQICSIWTTRKRSNANCQKDSE